MPDRPLTALPDAFAYARDGGPTPPSRVRFVAAEVTAEPPGPTSWFVLLALGLVTAVAGGLGSIEWRGGDDGRAVTLTAVAVAAALCGWWWAARMRARRAAGRARVHGERRAGLYLDGDALLWRGEGGFRVVRRAEVAGARAEAGRVVIEVGGERWAPPEALRLPPDAVAGLIERWREGRPIHD